MLTDSQIDDLAKKMNIEYEGCFFKSELPKQLKTNKIYIVNMQDELNDDGESNQGTHWTLAYIREYPNKKLESIYFDSYGMPPPEIIKKIIETQTKSKCPYSTKDIQSLMNNACGYYCLALGHFLTSSKYRTGNLYHDVEEFLEMFDDLNTSIDWKKNEYILKMFFQSENNKKEIDVLNYTHEDYERIVNNDSGGKIDLMKIKVDTKILNNKK